MLQGGSILKIDMMDFLLCTFPSSKDGMQISFAAEELGLGPWRWGMVLWIGIHNQWHCYLQNNNKWRGDFMLLAQRGFYKECGSKLSSQVILSFRICGKKRMTLVCFIGHAGSQLVLILLAFLSNVKFSWNLSFFGFLNLVLYVLRFAIRTPEMKIMGQPLPDYPSRMHWICKRDESLTIFIRYFGAHYGFNCTAAPTWLCLSPPLVRDKNGLGYGLWCA